jgi:hypothetical protein
LVVRSEDTILTSSISFSLEEPKVKLRISSNYPPSDPWREAILQTQE